MKTNFYLNNTQINEPNNWAELSIELNFDKDNPSAQVGINEWDFGVGGYDANKDGASLSNTHIENGLTNGVGIFEGVPFRIELEKSGVIYDLFDGYIDLTQSLIDCELVNGQAIERGGIDWLNQVADSVSFEYLYEETNLLNDSDFVAIPYVINSIPKAGEAFILALTAFVTVQTIKQEIQALLEMTVETSNPISAISGVLKISLRVIYIITLIVTVVKLILDAVKLIIQPVKYHKGMFIKDLLRIGAEHFGLEFKSSIFESAPFNKAVILPTQYTLPDTDDGLLGFLRADDADAGYYNGTYGELLRSLKVAFNAKIILQDGVLSFERRDYNLSTPTYELPQIERDGYRVNIDDFKSNIYIEFATDLNDKNTIQQYNGTATQIQTLPKTIINKDMVLAKGFDRRSIPYALGKRKTDFTVPEKIIRALAKVIDPVVGTLIKLVNAIIRVINAIVEAIKKLLNLLRKIGIKIDFDPDPIKEIQYTPLGELIDDRIGMLMLENDFISAPKMLLIDEKSNARKTKLTSDNETTVNAGYLWNNFHLIDSFDFSIFANTNQYKIYEISNVPFCFEDYEKVRNNNKIIDGEKEGIIDSLTWNIYNQTADIKFRINEIYTKNLETKVITSKKSNPFV
jgi:hypothetical protein